MSANNCWEILELQTDDSDNTDDEYNMIEDTEAEQNNLEKETEDLHFQIVKPTKDWTTHWKKEVEYSDTEKEIHHLKVWYMAQCVE